MSLLDDHVVRRAPEAWTVPDDPDDEVPVSWPEPEHEPGPDLPA